MMIGTTISHYKILEKLGEGGMGVVYKAEDTKLDRLVALKFLPPHLAASEQDKARFIQEAKAASALNHPNVCTIHAIEEHEGQIFIAMEFVDGQTLREKRGSVNFKQAIDIGIQIADGLAAAHEKGIVHRDIKPENIMIRKDGIVQIMDFGLAKLRASGSKISRLTKEGSTVGTAGYMSPEQVQGQDSDHRSDIFSLGVLLYELFTGQLPFKGVHETALMYEIVNVDVAPMSSIKTEIDTALDAIVLECLAKDPDERYQSVKEVSKELRRVKRDSNRQRTSRILAGSNTSESVMTATKSDSVGRRFTRERLLWMLAIPVFGILGFIVARMISPKTEVYTSRSNITPAEGTTVNNCALSPDGQTLAFSGGDSSQNRLWIRPLGSLTPISLPGTEDAEYYPPFWSPDNRFIAFFAQGKLKRIEVSGGTPVTICDAPQGRGGSWSPDGVIVFAPKASGPLHKVSAAGGVSSPITEIDSTLKERSHRWPFFLPDGRHFLFCVRDSSSTMTREKLAVYRTSLDGKHRQFLLHTFSNVSYASGFLLFYRDDVLFARPFNPESAEFLGEDIPFIEGLRYAWASNIASFSASQTGVIVYISKRTQTESKLVYYNRTGNRIGTIGKPAQFNMFSFSPDEKRLAATITDPSTRKTDIWILDLVREIRTKFTFDDEFNELAPLWSPDGSRIVFSSNRKGHFDLYMKNSDGSGVEEPLLVSDLNKIASGWSSDGRHIMYSLQTGRPQNDLWVLPMFGDRKPWAFSETSGDVDESFGSFSPDGRWIVYQVSETGRPEIYVRAFQGSAGKVQVSVNGGLNGRWAHSGKEIFYVSLEGKLMAASIAPAGSSVVVGKASQIFDPQAGTRGFFYDATKDGQRFLFSVREDNEELPPMTLAINWDEELRKK